MKLFLKILAVIILIIAVLTGLNWKTLQRLNKVNHLFEADVIVHNFTNMQDVLYSHDLPASGTAHIWPENPLPLPANIGVYGQDRNLAGFLEQTQTTALIVIRDGEILFEDYYLGTTKEDRRISWSVAKSFLSALFGIAVEKGQIGSLDDPVTQYVPALKGTAYDGASIRNVLNMASGVVFDENYLDPKSDINHMGRVLALGGSMDEFAQNLSARAREPGSGRQYVSVDTHVIGMVLRAVTGETMHDYFLDNLWSRLGPGQDAYYLTDGEDVAFVLGGLNMRSRDFALFGQLMVQGGQWKGEQIIPAAWIAQSTTASAPPDTEGTGVEYGFQWWVPRDSHGDYFAIGIYGQYIYIDPAANMVIVKNSAHRNFMSNGPSGQPFMLETIEAFRSIVEHYAKDG